MATIEPHMETSFKRRKHDPSPSLSLSSPRPPSPPPSSLHPPLDLEGGWGMLQGVIENEVLGGRIPQGGMGGFDMLARWFQIIVDDQEKLRLFRQWVLPSPDEKKVGLPIALAKIKKDNDSPPTLPLSPPPPPPPPSSSTTTLSTTTTTISTTSSSSSSSSHKVTSIDFINNETPITPRSTPQVLLLQQLLQQQQQQIVLLQKLQNASPSDGSGNAIRLAPSTGCAGVVLTVSLKANQWHPYSDTCNCTCGFTMMDGTVTTAHRIPGGIEGEMLFVVPPIPTPSSDHAAIPLVVHLTPCTSPHSPLVCASSFMYSRDRPAATTGSSLSVSSLSASASASSDSDSEGTPESSLDDGEDDEDSGENRSPSLPSQSSPKQLMTIRERMMSFVHSNAKGSARVVVVQQPPSRVVWKNRRLDTPFKVRVEGVSDVQTKLSVLAIVVDHKGKLQIDAIENFEEECTTQAAIPFHNLRMTKGTWGKEWFITFVAVRGATSNDPVVVGVSQPCPVVVKTRKNPQVRHVTRTESPSPISFVERKPTNSSPPPAPRTLKRNRVEDILDTTPSPPHPSSRSSSLHSEAMTNLLYAAEIKNQEREFQVARPPSAPSSIFHSSHPPPPPMPSSPPRSMTLPSIQSGFGSQESSNFANLQSLLGFLEDIKLKHHPKLTIVEQPQLKREGNVLIVKKGKPFRTPFRLQMRTTPPPAQRSDLSPVPDYHAQQYVCVAVLRNDKGEEVALKNSEVAFDARGLATFSGLMVMKGTWGKAVQLTFEARWGGARRVGSGGSAWPPLRMLVVCETPALQLMCYTKDKKTPTAG